LHVVGRFLSCPFLRVLDYIPPRARVLDIGSGHGIFAHLALAAGAREVIALEPDTRKVFLNRPRPGMRVVNGYRAAVRGRFAAVTMFDVLYRLPVPEWPDLFAQVRASLAPGGVLLLKELDPERPAKALWNRAQELVSDRAGLTLGDAWSYETRAQLSARLVAAGFSRVETVAIDRGYPHAHVLYIGRE
jgi:SAM-dependent methyltransferase